MLPTIHGGTDLCGSDIVLGVRVGPRLPVWPEAGEVVILIDDEGRMVKRLRHVAEEEGHTGRAWCWVEGDNAKRSMDSRNFGWVPSHQVEALAVAVAWPPWRAHWLLDKHRLERLFSASSDCCCFCGFKGQRKFVKLEQ